MNTIPDSVLDAYVLRYPHLATLVLNARAGSRPAIRTFAESALRLAAPPGVTASELWELSARAMGV